MASEIIQHRSEDEWLHGRGESIGSSDAAVILRHGYAGSSYYGLWAEKCKGVDAEYSEATRKMFKKGKIAEPYIAGLCKLEHDWDVQFDPPFSYRRSLDYPHLTASLDAWIIEEGRHVALEFKSLSGWMGRDWDAKNAKAPLKYTIQLQHQLIVTGWAKGYLVGLHGFDLHVVPVHRHETLIEAMLAEYEEFWGYVTSGKEPPVDDSEATHAALKRVYPARPLDAKHLGENASELVEKFLQAEKQLSADHKSLERSRNELTRLVGGAEYVVTADGQWYSFKSSRGGKRSLKPHKGKRVS